MTKIQTTPDRRVWPSQTSMRIKRVSLSTLIPLINSQTKVCYRDICTAVKTCPDLTLYKATAPDWGMYHFCDDQSCWWDSWNGYVVTLLTVICSTAQGQEHLPPEPGAAGHRGRSLGGSCRSWEMEWIRGKVRGQWRGVHRSQGSFTEQTHLLTQVGTLITVCNNRRACDNQQ